MTYCVEWDVKLQLGQLLSTVDLLTTLNQRRHMPLHWRRLLKHQFLNVFQGLSLISF